MCTLIKVYSGQSVEFPYLSFLLESYCLDDVIQYILNEIGPQKCQLLSRLGINESKEETLFEILESIPWRDISLHLERLGRSDIVDYITKNTQQ